MKTKEKLALLRKLMGPDDDDDTLSAYLTIAGRKIATRAYPYGRTFEGVEGETEECFIVPERYDILQVEIAQYLLNKRGAEGQTGHSESGVSRTYGSADVPQELIGQVVPMVGVL